MVAPNAYGTQQILKDIAAIRGQIANLQQNGNFNNLSASGLVNFTGRLLATGGTPNAPTNIETDNWTYFTPPSPLTGTLRIKLKTSLCVKVNAVLGVPSGAASGPLMLFSMPSAAYIPAVQQRGDIGAVPNGATTVAQLSAALSMRWQANPNGTFNIINFVGGAAATGVIEMSFNCEYDLDK